MPNTASCQFIQPFMFVMQNCVKYKCENYANAIPSPPRKIPSFYLTLRTIKTCVKMSNFMRNCVIEMEIASH